VETVAHKPPGKSDRLSLFAFIDAFGWELVQHYPDSWSFWQDFRILLKTFNAVVSGRGAA